VRGFTGRELSAFNTLRDAVLLVLGAFPNFTLGIGILDGGIVLVLVDLFGDLILLLRKGFLFRSGQLAVVELAHVTLFLVDRGFFLFQVGGFAGGQFPLLTPLAMRSCWFSFRS
jgi:hypothetical protein